jgi:hypothetical protein
MKNTGLSPKLPLSTSKVHYDMIFDMNENIKQNFKNLILTSPGERIMIPDFGVGIKHYLFELKKEVVFNQIKSDIENQVDRWMPFVKIDDISLYEGSQEDETKLSLYIRYSIPDLDIADQLIIN